MNKKPRNYAPARDEMYDYEASTGAEGSEMFECFQKTKKKQKQSGTADGEDEDFIYNFVGSSCSCRISEI